MVITLNADELPDWIEDSLLGVDVMFDEMSYREMEFALKEVMKAEDNRDAELREILLGTEKALTGSSHNGRPGSAKIKFKPGGGVGKNHQCTRCWVHSRTTRHRKDHNIGTRHHTSRHR